MLYDLGKRQTVSRGAAFVTFFSGLLAAYLIWCILAAISVRIGNLIIGW